MLVQIANNASHAHHIVDQVIKECSGLVPSLRVAQIGKFES